MNDFDRRVELHRASNTADGSAERQIKGLVGELPPPEANDGVVPLFSQVWGDLVWCGTGDHLDVVGHFASHGGHHDWLTSGAAFSRTRFDVIVDRIVAGMLVSEERGGGSTKSA